jgi:hypothetical protein
LETTQKYVVKEEDRETKNKSENNFQLKSGVGYNEKSTRSVENNSEISFEDFIFRFKILLEFDIYISV